MANTKEYGYYMEGGKIAIVQRDTSFDNDADSRDYGPGSDKMQWKSPLESVTEGLEIAYTYVPNYKEVNLASTQNGQPVSYKASNTTGKLVLTFSTGSDYSSSEGDWVLLKGAGRWNGVHKVISGSTNTMETDTNYSDGSSTSSINFGSRIAYNPNIIVMEDETYELDLPIYLQKALVYYIKAKLFEDIGDMKMREFFNREFKRQVERHNNGRIPGLRMISTGSSAIK